MNYYQLPTGDGAPQIVNVVVEVPAGTRNKVEYDPVLEVFRVDRVLYSPIHYPGDYGFLPSTLSPDGDALDVLVLVTDRTFTGCVLSARPIGLLDMRDEAGADEKVLAVPETDPRFEEIEDLPDLPQHLVKEVQYFFDVYKDLEGKETALLGWHPASTAHACILKAMEAFRTKA